MSKFTIDTVKMKSVGPVSYTEFAATKELRWLKSGKTRRLQQAWEAMALDSIGAVCGGKIEWRDVPEVVEKTTPKRKD